MINIKYFVAPFVKPQIKTVAKAITVRQAIDLLGVDDKVMTLVASVGGEWRLRGDWDNPVDADISIYNVPATGDGRSNLQLALTVGLTFGAPYLGWGWQATLMAGFAGYKMIEQLYPPPAEPASISPSYSLRGRNRYDPEAPQAEVFGKVKVVPNYVIAPYKEYVHGDEYLFEIFFITRGKATLSNHLIGGTPIPSEKQGYSLKVLQDVGYFASGFSKIYTNRNQVVRRYISAPNEKSYRRTPWIKVDTGGNFNCCEIHFDFNWVQNMGHSNPAKIHIAFRYLGEWWYGNFYKNPDPNSTEITKVYWVSDNMTIKIDVSDLDFKKSIGYNLYKGVFETRITRVDNKEDRGGDIDNLYWVGLKAVLTGGSTECDGTMVFRRTKASEYSQNLRGEYSVVAHRHLKSIRLNSDNSLPRDSNGVLVKTAERESSSIADAVLYLFEQIDDEKSIDFQQLYLLERIWISKGYNVNGVFDTKISFWQAVCWVLQCGMTIPLRLWNMVTFHMESLKQPVQSLITIDNMVGEGLQLELKMPKENHGLVKVLYYDGENFEKQELKVKSSDAYYSDHIWDEFTLNLRFVTNSSQAKAIGNMELKQRNYWNRYVKFVIPTPPGGLLYGTRHKLQYPLVSSEVCSGRVRRINWSNNILQLQDDLVLDNSLTYFIRFSLKDGSLSDSYNIMRSLPFSSFIIKLPADEVLLSSMPFSYRSEILSSEDMTGNASTYVIYKSETDMKEIIIRDVKPKGVDKVEVSAVIDDDRMWI